MAASQAGAPPPPPPSRGSSVSQHNYSMGMFVVHCVSNSISVLSGFNFIKCLLVVILFGD